MGESGYRKTLPRAIFAHVRPHLETESLGRNTLGRVAPVDPSHTGRVARATKPPLVAAHGLAVPGRRLHFNAAARDLRAPRLGRKTQCGGEGRGNADDSYSQESCHGERSSAQPESVFLDRRFDSLRKMRPCPYAVFSPSAFATTVSTAGLPSTILRSRPNP